mmetsp:Transcript_7250/g.30899  ORF Transcript_7250/g.30899 Transcript_7250/m.30899 type:complete len:235 (-) Transcript_7250:1102-1806(-)
MSAMGRCTMDHAAMYATPGNILLSRCLYATYFCSTENVSSEKLEKEMCKTQKSNMPSFSKPRSFGRSNHTDPKIRDVITAAPTRAVMNNLFRMVIWNWRFRTHKNCVYALCGKFIPYCAFAKSVASSTSRPSGAAFVFVDFSNNSPDSLQAVFNAFVVSGVPVDFSSDDKSAVLPVRASAFAGLATKFTSQSATSSPLFGAGAAKPSLPKYAAASFLGPWYTGAPSLKSSRWSN